MSAVTFDIIAVLVFFVFAAYGWVTGFLSSLYGFIGALIGILLEAVTMPFVLSATDNGQIRFLVGIIYGFVLVSMCSVGAEILGIYVRDRMGLTKSRISRLAGSLFKVMLAGVLIWVFFSPLSVQSNTSMGRLMRESRVIQVLNVFAPQAAQQIPEMLDASARTASLQQMSERSSQLAAEAAAPDPSILNDPEVVKARRSVVKVFGEAPDCHRKLEGTGFVFSPGLVVSNAHVIAGARKIVVQTVKGSFRARPIVFDPLRDVAVMWVPDIASSDLLIPAILPASQKGRNPGISLVIPGFPNNGPYRVVPARLLEQFILRGPGIYGTTMVERKAYAILGAVMSGNSGGPVLNAHGRYLGMVFGVSTEKSDTAYTLTSEEMEPVLQKSLTTREEVSTGRCISLESEISAATSVQKPGGLQDRFFR